MPHLLESGKVRLSTQKANSYGRPQQTSRNKAREAGVKFAVLMVIHPPKCPLNSLVGERKAPLRAVRWVVPAAQTPFTATWALGVAGTPQVTGTAEKTARADAESETDRVTNDLEATTTRVAELEVLVGEGRGRIAQLHDDAVALAKRVAEAQAVLEERVAEAQAALAEADKRAAVAVAKLETTEARATAAEAREQWVPRRY
jgi:hypothetical protein